MPQGSILGPLLFLVFVNDLPNAVKHSNTNLYADDTYIYASQRGPAIVGNMLEEDLRDIGQWLDVNGIKCGHNSAYGHMWSQKEALGVPS